LFTDVVSYSFVFDTNRMKNFIKIFFLLTALLAFSCAQRIPTLFSLRQEIISYYESGGYDKETTQVVDNAINKFKSIKTDDSTAVVFDIDDTALSYYELSKKIQFGYVPELWDEWVDQDTVPAIPEVKKLYDFLVAHGFRIIFLSGRKEYNYSGTIRNLKVVGYAKFDTLIVRNKNEYDLTALLFKSNIREKLTAKGYEIVGTVGDQWSDLKGPYHGIQVKIPNYIYSIE
jgi:acid phosphatase